MNQLPLDATPLGPESRIVIMTGPITGNGFTPGGTKVTAVYLSPLTGNTLGRGAGSGYWGTYLKAAGYDGIIASVPRPNRSIFRSGKAMPSFATRRHSGGWAHALQRIACGAK